MTTWCAYYLSRFQGTRFLGASLAAIAKILSERPSPDGKRAVPMSLASLSYRIGDFLCRPNSYCINAPESKRDWDKLISAGRVERRLAPVGQAPQDHLCVPWRGNEHEAYRSAPCGRCGADGRSWRLRSAADGADDPG